MTNGWEEAAANWIAGMGDEGDFARRCVLDAPMLARAQLSDAKNALDVGCGEGRFCRMLAARGLKTAGVDSAASLIARARRLHPGGDYRSAQAERLPFDAGSFDLVVTYLSLIDIADVKAAIGEMNRVLRPGGHLLIANLSNFCTASHPMFGTRQNGGGRLFAIDHYMDERSEWVELGPLTVLNWHRPLSAYMALLLGCGLQLRHFDEPLPQGGDPKAADVFRRAPPFLLMDWEKS